MSELLVAEERRLEQSRVAETPWKKWGPYLTERQWGTVREDYSENGNAWDYFSHDQARSRAYRWGEDGLAGISENQQFLCFALALWNGKDPILKERLFGLTNSEGNHGEDVKEYYFYLDSTPTHSYVKYLYKYPQRAFPYEDLVKTNRRRSRLDIEYELLDTGVFDDDRYFDIFVEYAKDSPEDILIQITVWNRAAEAASLHVLPTLWFRNTWSWYVKPAPRPNLWQFNNQTISARHPNLGERFLYAEGNLSWLFTENETNNERLFHRPNASPYVKDAINNYIVHEQIEAVNPKKTGTKTAADYSFAVPAGGSQTIRLRLTPRNMTIGEAFGSRFEAVLRARLREADEFYDKVIPPKLTPDEKLVMRQACAGMLWSKQFYYYPVDEWMSHDVSNDVLPPDCACRIAKGGSYRVDYEPAESSTGLFGGNSNWRGPIWMPVNALLVQSLRKLYSYYGNDFKVECPTGSGHWMTLWEVADEIARRLCRIFLRGEHGTRPVYGGSEKFQRDPYWRDLILFYEYFHGDNGAGIGASHQTGWTGLVAWSIKSRAVLDPAEVLENDFDNVAMKIVRSY